MPLRRWIASANNAIEGILYAARTQRHLRYHLYAAVAVLLTSYVLGVGRTDFLIISLAIILVLLCEMLNTAIEFVVDLVSPEYAEKARVAKDVAAGAVLISAFGAVIVGYIILLPYFVRAFESGVYVARHAADEIAVITVVVVLIVVIVMKAYFGKGHPLRGGMPSGHSAIAFSVWAAVTLMSANFSASLLCLAMAIAIAQSRVAMGTHSYAEVIIGALLGAVVTFALFAVFS